MYANRLGEIRNCRFESQRDCAGGLNLVVPAITLWDTVYLERAINAMREAGTEIDFCFSLSLRSAGSTLTSPAITPGTEIKE